MDSVGSHTLTNVLAQTQYRGVVTACGLAQGLDLPGSVLPFILRNVTLAGIDSVNAPQEVRIEAWSRLARDLDLSKLARTTQVVGLSEVSAVVGRMFEGKVRGRTVVDVNIVIDYKKEDFETTLQDYDVVLDTLGAEVLEKSLRVLKPGGKLISISGPPDPDFAKDIGSSWSLGLAMRLLSYRIRKKAKRYHVTYSFLFMRANGNQLREIGSLVDAHIIRPVVDRIFPFESTKEALAYVEKGRAKGKVVVKVR